MFINAQHKDVLRNKEKLKSFIVVAETFIQKILYKLITIGKYKFTNFIMKLYYTNCVKSKLTSYERNQGFPLCNTKFWIGLPAGGTPISHLCPLSRAPCSVPRVTETSSLHVRGNN